MNPEIYPMPFFANLLVSDLERSASFYEDTLGFAHIFTMPGPGGNSALVHLRWMKYADLLITKSDEGKNLPAGRGSGVTLNFQLFDRYGGNVEAFARAVEAKGASVSGPVNRPWNVREVTIIDPDGYRLLFTSPIDMTLSLNEVVDKSRSGEPPKSAAASKGT